MKPDSTHRGEARRKIVHETGLEWAIVPYTGVESQGEQLEDVIDVVPISMISDIFDDNYEYEEGEYIHSYSKEEVAAMFAMPVEDVYIEEGPMRFTSHSEHSDEQVADDFDEVIIEDITDEEYPKYMSNMGETLPTFPKLNVQKEALLKRKIDEKKIESASKETESSKKPSEPIKDPVVQEFDIEAWFKKPDWKNRPRESDEELKRRLD